jgi:AraC-like DNA-binding protein
LTYPSLRTQRTPKLIRRADPELYVVGLILQGEQSIAQARREVTITGGELVLYSSSAPFNVRVNDSGTAAVSVLALFPRALQPFPFDKVDRLLATRLSGSQGIEALLAQLLTQLATGTNTYTPADGPRLGMVLLDLVIALLGHRLDDTGSVPPESHRQALFLRIRAFIEQHLGEPGLTPTAIAAAHQISPRYLYALFQDQNLAVATWIRHRRLDHCRRDLADPQLATHPVHTIGARWGFGDAAHFSRAFRAAYDISPTDYRHLAQPRYPVRESSSTVREPSRTP